MKMGEVGLGVRTATGGEGRSWRRAARLAGTLLVAGGLLLVSWTAVVYLWQDPFTAAYNTWQQRQLSQGYDTVVSRYESQLVHPVAATADRTPLATIGARYRRNSEPGAPIARLEVPRLDLDVVMLNGTDTGSLKKGPGRHLQTSMPGQGELVYVAGHRTTFGAPFARIDAIKPGDRVVVRMPYGSFEYRATGHSIVDADDLSVLRSPGRERLALQACHPRFFATQRYIVWADLVRVTLPPRLRGHVSVPKPVR